MAKRTKLGTALKAARERAGLTLRQVARLTGLSEPQVSNLEGGKPANPGWATVSRMAKALGMSLDELAGIKPAKVPVGAMVPKSRAQAALSKAEKSAAKTLEILKATAESLDRSS